MSTQPEPAQPQTEAGRKLLTAIKAHDFFEAERAILAIEAEASRAATAAARAEPGRDDAHIRTPEGPDDYCTGCGELWPCSFQRGRAAARAEVARQVRELARDRGDDEWDTVVRQEVLAILAQQPPEVREPER